MAWSLEGLSEAQLVAWIERQTQASAAAGGYQGQIFRYRGAGRDLAVKVAGPGPLSFLRRAMLRREARIYRRLDGFSASPRCHGLLHGRYLVLDFIAAVPRYRAVIPDRERFFARLRADIDELHRRGIAHGDLQKKDNLLVTPAGEPVILDYGVALARRPGFAPLNHLLWNFLARLDSNTWVKLKYRGRPEEASARDARYYRRTRTERAARALKRGWRKLFPKR